MDEQKEQMIITAMDIMLKVGEQIDICRLMPSSEIHNIILDTLDTLQKPVQPKRTKRTQRLSNEDLLEQLAYAWGMGNVEDMLSAAIFDSLCPGICTNYGCGYTIEVEPDNNAGWCDICGTQTVKSCLVLAGIE
jgi:hypothetical protein